MAEIASFRLAARDRVSLPAVVYSHGWSKLLPFAWDDDARVLHRIEQIGDAVVELSFTQADGDAIEMQVTSQASLSEADQDVLVARARWMLSLDEDLSEFYGLCRTDPHLEHVPKEARGRILRSASVFEDAVKCICTTNTTWARTKGMVRRLVEKLGKPSSVSDRRAFPTPQAIAAVDEGALGDQVRLGYRTAYVHELARRVAAGELELEALRTSAEPAPKLFKQLLKIKGIGPYAAATLMALLGRYDYIGVDTWARKMISKQFYGGQRVSDREIQSAFGSFGRWQALAYWFYRWDEM